jgi:hypothetical protein
MSITYSKVVDFYFNTLFKTEGSIRALNSARTISIIVFTITFFVMAMPAILFLGLLYGLAFCCFLAVLIAMPLQCCSFRSINTPYIWITSVFYLLISLGATLLFPFDGLVGGAIAELYMQADAQVTDNLMYLLIGSSLFYVYSTFIHYQSLRRDADYIALHSDVFKNNTIWLLSVSSEWEGVVRNCYKKDDLLEFSNLISSLESVDEVGSVELANSLLMHRVWFKVLQKNKNDLKNWMASEMSNESGDYVRIEGDWFPEPAHMKKSREDRGNV